MKHDRQKEISAVLRDDRDRLSAELRAANQRLEEFHEILQRKNAIIRLLALGDCTAEEFRLSDGE